MCGIFGYIGSKENGINSILDGIRELEHRGYDSMGVAFLDERNRVKVYKISQAEQPDFTTVDLAKKIPNLQNTCSIGIGHTRWATFGGKTTKNAHPHHDQAREFFIVHNGNVENFDKLKKGLGAVKFYSETDTEVIINLLANQFKAIGDLVEATKNTLATIEGANSILVMYKGQPDMLVAANRGGSMMVGKNNNCVIVASDPAAFEPFGIIKENTKALESNEVMIINRAGWQIASVAVARKSKRPENGGPSLNSFKHFMEKEIFEQPKVLIDNSQGRLLPDIGSARLGGIDDIARELRKVETFHFVGCGTAYYACCYAALLFNRFGMSARSWVASEFCYSHPVFAPTDAFVFISQSGETADTIEVVNEIKMKGNICLGIVNVVDSRIARDTDAGVYIRAGRERGVASTKAFIAQLSTVVKLALFLARQRKMTIDTGQKIIKELELIPDKMSKILSQASLIQKLTLKYKAFNNCYFLGRCFNFIAAQEGSLKLKEVAYVHSESYPLGEMKHGPLALIDNNFCSIVIIPRDSTFQKGKINLREIKGRGGPIIAITNEEENFDILKIVDDSICIPVTVEYLSPLLTIIPLQLFAYFMALEYGHNPDKPRNLAKTVTVG